MELFNRISSHVGIIPDGNKSWAQERGYPKKYGYKHEIAPG